jgi:hypothetical protein
MESELDNPQVAEGVKKVIAGFQAELTPLVTSLLANQGVERKPGLLFRIGQFKRAS